MFSVYDYKFFFLNIILYDNRRKLFKNYSYGEMIKNGQYLQQTVVELEAAFMLKYLPQNLVA